jgi:hypothetical protein
MEAVMNVVGINSHRTRLSSIVFKGGFRYVQVVSGKQAYIYEKWRDNRLVGYEVFLKKRKSIHHINNISIPAGERFPNDEAFGYWAWECKTEEKAKLKFESLEG